MASSPGLSPWCHHPGRFVHRMPTWEAAVFGLLPRAIAEYTYAALLRTRPREGLVGTLGRVPESGYGTVHRGVQPIGTDGDESILCLPVSAGPSRTASLSDRLHPSNPLGLRGHILGEDPAGDRQAPRVSAGVFPRRSPDEGDTGTGSPMTEDRSDRELAGRVVEGGDEAAFRTLYRRHTPAVYQFVLRLVGGDAQEAEDVMQETWMRAARGLGSFRWESAFRSWLTGIALNRVRELARRKKRSLVEMEGNWEVAARAALPGDGGRDPGQRIDLERALELLPPGFRTVLVLHDVEGFTHQEIGERLGITDGTSKSQLHGARKAMRRLLSWNLETA